MPHISICRRGPKHPEPTPACIPPYFRADIANCSAVVMQMPKRRSLRNFSLTEQLRLVLEIHNVLPVDTANWKQFEACFNAHETLGKRARSIESWQRKLASIWRIDERTHRSNRSPLHKMVCEVRWQVMEARIIILEISRISGRINPGSAFPNLNE
jgi:hypothetical protein